MDIIIGAGITGLSFARFDAGHDYLILEKDCSIGGYARTTKRNGFVWDYSGHFFHFQDPSIEKIVAKNMDKSQILTINKVTHIKYKDLLVDYPFQKNIHQLSKDELIDCLYDLFTAKKNDYKNFKEMLYCKFGKSISEKFLIPYNTKLYACELNTLDKNAMGRFFPYAEKEDIIRNFKKNNNNSYNSTFEYPRGGAVEYVNSIATGIDKKNICMEAEVESINLNNHSLLLSSGVSIKYDRLISTISFPLLAQKTDLKYNKDVFTWNKVLVFNLGFNKKGKNTSDNWIYFPENKYCFYRVGFYDNILGQDKMSLYVELGFSKDASIIPEDWKEKVLNDLCLAGIVDENLKLIDYETILMDPAYVHINEKSINEMVRLKSELAKYDVYSIGRYGSWTYCSIEDNIKEAKNLSENINNL